jgi:hypothetical protein
MRLQAIRAGMRTADVCAGAVAASGSQDESAAPW